MRRGPKPSFGVRAALLVDSIVAAGMGCFAGLLSMNSVGLWWDDCPPGIAFPDTVGWITPLATVARLT